MGCELVILVMLKYLYVYIFQEMSYVTNFSQDYDIIVNHLVTQTVHVYTFTHKMVIVRGCPLTFVMISRPHLL